MSNQQGNNEETDTIKKSETILEVISQIKDSMELINEITQKDNSIALYTSIDAARIKSDTNDFTLLANQMRQHSNETSKFAKRLGKEIERLESQALKALAVRYADISYDIIDKIDRNLFERNCDCQAWAQFHENVKCAIALKDFKNKEFLELLVETRTEDKMDAVKDSCQRLQSLNDTYQVYSDILLLNNKGIVIASAKDNNLIGNDQSDSEFFKEVMIKSKVYVTDMYYSEDFKSHIVAFSAPVIDEHGKTIGVLSTRFNWYYIIEMIDKIPLEEGTQAFLLSQDGSVLANCKKQGILKDNMSWLMAGEAAVEKGSGYTAECERNGAQRVWGYCHTYGYNAYKGKGWASIVTHPVLTDRNVFFHEKIDREGNAKKYAADFANGNLQEIAENVRNYVNTINEINKKTNVLAVNAYIQASSLEVGGEAFSVIASEIDQLAKQSEDYVKQTNKLTEKLDHCVRDTVFTRLKESAFDIIDKIDRNLFERNCDVQVFASFPKVINCAKNGKNNNEIQELFSKIHTIHEVYYDIFLLDEHGRILTAAIRHEVENQNQADREWFKQCIAGNLVVTDLYYSETIGEYTVSFAAPVKDGSKVIGVLTTRFNCEFIYDIMKSTVIGKGNLVYLINSQGIVIGSPDGEGILEKSFAHLKVFKLLDSTPMDYIVENDPGENDKEYCIGFAKTKGYLNYKGKGWSILVRQCLA